VSTKRAQAADGPKFYNVREVAQMFRMSRMTVYRAIASKELAAVRMRGRWLVPARVIDALIEQAVNEQGDGEDAAWLPHQRFAREV
jgi:excisionase family DNA binding protein